MRGIYVWTYVFRVDLCICGEIARDIQPDRISVVHIGKQLYEIAIERFEACGNQSVSVNVGRKAGSRP
jgi:hypothetical protein